MVKLSNRNDWNFPGKSSLVIWGVGGLGFESGKSPKNPNPFQKFGSQESKPPRVIFTMTCPNSQVENILGR